MLINQTYSHVLRRKAASFEKEKEIFPVQITSLSEDPNPHIFSVVHETLYEYSSKVPLSKHLLRFQPVHDLYQSVLSYELHTSPQGEVQNFMGVFGNHASFLEIREPYEKLRVVSQSIVCVSEIPANIYPILHQPRTIPLIWMPWDNVMMHAYSQPPELPESELFELSNYAMSFVQRNKNDILDILLDINSTIYTDYTYVPDATSLFTTPYEIYVNRKGVCQDFANLFICLARLLNVPARYRVGYVYTGGNYDKKIRSDASHAWIEVYLPYIGWIGFDPTNGCMVGKNHIKVSCGRYFLDAAPFTGTLFGQVENEKLSVSVQVVSLNT